MAQSCSNPGCTAKGTKTCGRCKTASYCGKLCQKENWAVHKASCNPPSAASAGSSSSEEEQKQAKADEQIRCVKIYGQGGGGGRYEDVLLPWSHPIFQTAPLPVTLKFDFPLVVHRLVPNLPRGFETDNQHATWLMIDPVSGFAPSAWQGGIGDVFVARPDREPLSHVVLAGITDYISDILDAFGEENPQPRVRSHYNRARLDRYLVQHEKMQMDYLEAMRNFNLSDATVII